MKNLLIILLITTVLPSCRKERTDEEIREMIVGTWCAKIKKGSFPKASNFMVVEFDSEGRYRFLNSYGFCENIKVLDDITKNNINSNYILFDDSIYYEIDEGKISFVRKGVLLKDNGIEQLGFNTIDLQVSNISNKSFRINNEIKFNKE